VEIDITAGRLRRKSLSMEKVTVVSSCMQPPIVGRMFFSEVSGKVCFTKIGTYH
jgi:hypothetical protein